jgi:hypothetical protein
MYVWKRKVGCNSTNLCQSIQQKRKENEIDSAKAAEPIVLVTIQIGESWNNTFLWKIN